MFLQVSVCPRGGLSQHALQGVSQHALQQVSRGVASQHALQGGCLLPGGCLVWRVEETPPTATSRRLLWRAVCILLECILVSRSVYSQSDVASRWILSISNWLITSSLVLYTAALFNVPVLCGSPATLCIVN